MTQKQVQSATASLVFTLQNRMLTGGSWYTEFIAMHTKTPMNNAFWAVALQSRFDLSLGATWSGKVHF